MVRARQFFIRGEQIIWNLRHRIFGSVEIVDVDAAPATLIGEVDKMLMPSSYPCLHERFFFGIWVGINRVFWFGSLVLLRLLPPKNFPIHIDHPQWLLEANWAA